MGGQCDMGRNCGWFCWPNRRVEPTGLSRRLAKAVGLATVSSSQGVLLGPPGGSRASRKADKHSNYRERMTGIKQQQKHIRMEQRVKQTVTVLHSGGIDSSALLAFYLRQGFEVRPLFVDFGQPAAREEICAARAVCSHYGVNLTIVTVRSSAAFSIGEILGRNAFLVFAAVLVFGMKYGIVAIGIHEGSPYYDCTEGFVQSIQKIVDGYAAGRIKIAAPFLRWTKEAIWEFCKKAGVPVESTYSCEQGGAYPCGECLSCRDREALYAL